MEKKNNNNTNPFLGSTTPKKESLSSRHITGKNPFESPLTPEDISEEQILPKPAPTNPFLKLQKESSDTTHAKNPFAGISNANPFNSNDSSGRIRSNSMPANTSSTNLFVNPYFMNQTTTFSNSQTNVFTQQQQPSLSQSTTEGRRRFSTNPFDMVDDEDVIRAANEDFTPDNDETEKNNETEKESPNEEKVVEKMEDEVEEKPESNSDLFASMFASNPETNKEEEQQQQQQQTSEKQEESEGKPESNSDLFASMFNTSESKQDAIEEQTKVPEIESPKKNEVSDKFISSILDTIPDNVQVNNKNSEDENAE